jgi:hypothetical protein
MFPMVRLLQVGGELDLGQEPLAVEGQVDRADVRKM